MLLVRYILLEYDAKEYLGDTYPVNTLVLLIFYKLYTSNKFAREFRIEFYINTIIGNKLTN